MGGDHTTGAAAVPIRKHNKWVIFTRTTNNIATNRDSEAQWASTGRCKFYSSAVVLRLCCLLERRFCVFIHLLFFLYLTFGTYLPKISLGKLNLDILVK